jgi:hypothetical protein
MREGSNKLNIAKIKNLLLVLSLIPITLFMWSTVGLSLGVTGFYKITTYGIIGFGLLIPGLFIKER